MSVGPQWHLSRAATIGRKPDDIAERFSSGCLGNGGLLRRTRARSLGPVAISPCDGAIFIREGSVIRALNFGLTPRHQPASDPLRQCPERLPCVRSLHGNEHGGKRVEELRQVVEGLRNGHD